MDPDRFHVSPSARASLSGDGLVLLDVHGGLMLASNTIGAQIWQLLEQGRTRPEIARQLADDYGVLPDRVLRDVEAFVAALLDRGLLTVERRC